MKILLIDDDPNVRNLAADVLSKKLNIVIIEAANGSEGLALLQKEEFGLIILDNEMPMMDGYQFLGNVRSNTKLKKLPVIVLTSSNDNQTLLKYLNLDVSDYILKPFLPDELIKKVTKYVSPKKKLLMIDDNKAFKVFIEKIISTRFNSIDFFKADNGADGITKVLDYEPDLILLDIHMPEMTGLEFMEKFRTEYGHIKTPIIMLTSVDDKETIQFLAENKIFDYILKPVDINDFARKISRALNLPQWTEKKD